MNIEEIQQSYGIDSSTDLTEIISDVVDCLGGGQLAEDLLLEICTVETGQGSVEDKTLGAGMGICQFDEIGFDDVKERTRQKHIDKLHEKWPSLNWDNIKWEDLRNSPLLSFIWCRLKFKLIPDGIPDTIEGRADYWKKYYNTEAGKGTPAHYLEMCKIFIKSVDNSVIG